MSETNQQQPGGGEEHEQERLGAPRIYVASLSDYNAGRLHGAWLDADQDGEEMLAGIRTMLAASREPGAEEWAIHDFEGFGTLRLSEYEDINFVATVGQGIAEHGLAFAAWASYLGSHTAEDLEGFEDAYRGRWESPTAYAEEFLTDIGMVDEIERVVPDSMQQYVHIDFQAWANDVVMSGGLVEVDDGEGGVFLFSP